MPISVIRALRFATKLPQAEFAKRLDVSTETYRAWDSNRRQPSSEVLDKARALAARGSRDQSLGLPALAKILGVSVYRLREAARDGRLAVTYENRIVFGRPSPKATQAAGEAYRAAYYGKRARWTARPAAPPVLPAAPPDYDRQLIQLRRRLGLSQMQLATRINAAGRAVVYQWESRRRRPSPLLWRRVQELERALPHPFDSATSSIRSHSESHASAAGSSELFRNGVPARDSLKVLR